MKNLLEIVEGITINLEHITSIVIDMGMLKKVSHFKTK
jgi:hypothetical protein